LSPSLPAVFYKSEGGSLAPPSAILIKIFGDIDLTSKGWHRNHLKLKKAINNKIKIKI